MKNEITLTLDYCDKLREIGLIEWRLTKAIKLTNFPIISSDDHQNMLEVLGYVIEESLEKASKHYEDAKRIEQKYSEITGRQLILMEKAFKEFGKTHLKLCESYVDLENRVNKRRVGEFERLLRPKSKGVEYEIRKQPQNNLIQSNESEYEICIRK